jgi:hypothetical protein
VGLGIAIYVIDADGLLGSGTGIGGAGNPPPNQPQYAR